MTCGANRGSNEAPIVGTCNCSENYGENEIGECENDRKDYRILILIVVLIILYLFFSGIILINNKKYFLLWRFIDIC